jgi:ribonuclease T2
MSSDRNPGMFDIVRLQDDSAVAEWDSFVFSVQWPITTCITWKESKPTHTCILPSISSAANNSSSNNRYWTVHGVWPSRTGSSEGPFFCNRTWEFNPEGVATLRSQLVKLWPNIHGDDTEDSLWRHEWDKHGTCAAVDQRFASEELYFNQGIQWVHITCQLPYLYL